MATLLKDKFMNSNYQKSNQDVFRVEKVTFVN